MIIAKTTYDPLIDKIVLSKLNESNASNKSQRQSAQSKRLMGLFYMFQSVLVFSITLLLMKIIMKTNPNITALEIIFVRQISLFLFNLPLMWQFKVSPKQLSNSDMKKLFTRTLILVTQWILSYFTVVHLPMGVYQAISNTAPLMTSVLSFLILGETLSSIEFMNLVISFAGVMLISYSSLENNRGHQELVN